ncbi:tape measure protein [Acinetobacter sp. 251-1]|uniref:tape measure protein n=1 Tax=Acinetobacter sp. 251-1 TaxID=2746720 RepID=UPI002574A08E|nr:tape measure protein [Acinetobacter sp. 251-1]MDM1760708.1 tape measure protein [Acinetobacter sp. 251-1]
MAQESILRIVIDSRNAERNAQALDRELRSIQRNGDFASRSMDGMSVATRQLAGYMMGVVTAGAAIAKMDDYTNLNNRLRLVTNSQKELTQAMKDTFDIAQRSGAAWGGTAAIYQKIQYNSEKLGLSQQKVARITESISKSISNSGSSAQAAQAALYQLGQAFDKSSLNGDEFVSMSENAGYLMEVFAKGLGVTRAELKAMSTAGELTTDKMVQAIEKMTGSIEEDFGKTNFTIGQSFTQLNNAATQFIGGAGEASGAASFLSSSIKGLADNLDSIAHIAVLGGVAMLTKAILTQSVAMKKGIADSIADRAAKTAQLESHVRLAALEVQRTRQVTALAATEVNLARAEYNSAQTRAARAAATIRLTQAEVAHRLALNQGTAALAAQTVAQNALNASRAVGTRLLGLVGGPIGALTIGVTALAAGYMYMQKRTEEASKKLEEQTQVAERTTEELLKLKGVEADVAKKDLEEAFEGQNKKLKELNYQFNAFVISVQNANKGNEEVAEISRKVRLGLISQADALEQLNSLNILTPEQKKQGLDFVNANIEQASTTVKVADKLKLYGNQVELNGNKATNASVGLDKYTEALNKNASAADKAAKAQKDYFDSLNQDVLSANERLAYMNLGFSKEVIDQINKLQEEKQKALGDGVTAIVTTEEISRIIQAQNILDKVKEKEDEITEAKRKQNKESKDQLKITERLVGLVGSTGKSTGNHLDIRYDRSYSNGAISAEHMARFQLGGKTLDPKNSNSPYGMRTHPITGKQQLHRGYDFRAPEGTQVTTNFAVKNVETFYDKKGGGYTSRVTFEDGVIVNLLHQIPEMKSKIKGGVSKGHSASSNEAYEAFLTQQKESEQIESEQYQSRERIAYDYKDRILKIEKDLENEISEIQKANFSPKDTAGYIENAKHRADLEKRLYVAQLTEDVSSWRLSEERKLELKKNVNDLMIQLDADMNDDFKNQALQSAEDQYQHELALIRFAREEREFQMRLQFMSETQAMEERYELEEKKLIEVNDLQERNFKREMLRLQKQEEVKNRSDNAMKNWGNIQSEIYGTGEMDQLGHTRNDRYKASEELFNSNMLSIDQQEQNPTADLFEIAALREKAWQEHNDRMLLIDQQYNHESLNMRLGYAVNSAGALANMFKVMQGESSTAYRALYMAQKMFALSQAGMNVFKSASDAYANEPGTWYQKAGAAAMATLESSAFVSLIQAATPQGFATGGHVRGPGTSTSDSIPAMLSDYEFVTKASAVKKIGVANMEYMNRTGEMPFQREYEELHKRIAGNQLPEPFIVSKYKDGGLVGSSRVQPNSYSQIYRERQLVEKRSPEAKQAKVTIINQTSQPVEATSQWDGDELKVILTEMRKQNEAMMDAKIEKRFRMANRQGWK